MESKFVVSSFQIKVESEEGLVFDTIYNCCEDNDGEFVTVMSRYLGNTYMAIAFKRHILYEIERCTGREISWRT